MNNYADSQYIVEKSDDGRVTYFPVSENVLSLRRNRRTSRAERPTSEVDGSNVRIEEIRPVSLKELPVPFKKVVPEYEHVHASPEIQETPLPSRHSCTKRNLTVTVLTLFFISLAFGGSPVSLSTTISFFRDIETSRNNVLAAGLLAFRLNPGEVTEEIAVGETVVISPKFMPDDGTFPIVYRVNAEIVGEATPLCSLLHAVGTSSPLVYDGLLTQLTTVPSNAVGNGHLEVTLPVADGIADGAMCTVDIVYRGWHPGAPENTGYTDEESDRFTFVYKASPDAMAALAPADDEPLPVEETLTDETAENIPENEEPAESGESGDEASNGVIETPTEAPSPDAPAPADNYSPSGAPPAPLPEESAPETESTPESAPIPTETETPSSEGGNDSASHDVPPTEPPSESPPMENPPNEAPPLDPAPPVDSPPPSDPV